MKIRKHYLNCTLADISYLLPYGQSIVDYAAGLQVNETAARLLTALRQGADRDTLLSMLESSGEVTEHPQAKYRQDLNEFLDELARQGALIPNTPASPYAEHLAQLGPLVLSLHVPDSLWARYFQDFACLANHPVPHQCIRIYPQPPAFRKNGTILVRSRDLLIAETEDSYLFLPLSDSALREMHVSKDGSLAELYCPTVSETTDEELFHAIRFAFLIAAARNDLYVLHSASLLYRKRAWLFSGPSGAGKSTHTGLWTDAFGTPILNGDLNMLGIENGRPVCYGIPWNGTSGVRTVGSWPLGGITFLKKAPTDEVEIPSEDRKILYLSQRLISPSWTADQFAQSLAFCERLCACAPIFSLCCTRETNAAQVMRAAIDRTLDDSPQ